MIHISCCFLIICLMSIPLNPFSSPPLPEDFPGPRKSAPGWEGMFRGPQYLCIVVALFPLCLWFWMTSLFTTTHLMVQPSILPFSMVHWPTHLPISRTECSLWFLLHGHLPSSCFSCPDHDYSQLIWRWLAQFLTYHFLFTFKLLTCPLVLVYISPLAISPHKSPWYLWMMISQFTVVSTFLHSLRRTLSLKCQILVIHSALPCVPAFVRFSSVPHTSLMRRVPGGAWGFFLGVPWCMMSGLGPRNLGSYRGLQSFFPPTCRAAG